MEAKIIFKDGTQITAEQNGTCYILNEKPEFPEDMTGLIIQKEDGNIEFQYPLLIECASIDGNYWFSFMEEPADQKVIRELKEENAMLEDAILELAELIGE